MTKKLILLLFAVIFVAFPAFAILGLGDIVFDPSNLDEAIQQLAQMEQQYLQLVQTYEMVQNQYREMLLMAQHLPAQAFVNYRTPGIPWVQTNAADLYGNTTGWTNSINQGGGANGGYTAATEPLDGYGSALSNVPGDQQRGVKTSYATVELADGANLAALQTIGALRGNAPTVENVIQNLENDSLSTDPTLNTEIAVLNKINAAGIVQLRAGQDTNKLLVALAESQVIESKRTRDAEARAFNQHISFIQNAQAAMAAQSANASAAMLAWRMP